ncbi:hypothetical protein THRCLA_08213 [Thraustotheca clavata]|uniref:PHD-type domain-containing protein n=1 Tax=Thraustotheca clavata TaxID=74557 RepID=A0A1V9Z8A7_9STRA|nr:hypothetical protein THRCLA_08213 [Thraustotheca clavata]
MPVMNFGAQDVESHATPLSRLVALCEMGSDSSGDESPASSGKPQSADRTQELIDFVLTTMRQLARMSTRLSSLVPNSQQTNNQNLLLPSQETAGRLWNSLHKINATVDAINESIQGGDVTLQALDLTLLPPDPSMALETINVKLLSAHKKLIQQPHAEHNHRSIHNTVEAAWQKGEDAAVDHARRSLACWRNSSADLKAKVHAALNADKTETPPDNSALLQEMYDFLATVQLCNVVKPESPSEADQSYKTRSVDELVNRLQSTIAATVSASASRQKQSESRKRPLAKPPLEPLVVEKRRRPSTSPYALPNRKTSATPSHLQGVRTYAAGIAEGDAEGEVGKEELEGTDEVSAPAPPSEPVGCELCRENNCHDKMLLCDNNCGRVPPLDDIPDGDWFCPECEQSLCLAQKCKRVCVLDRKYCSRHLCKDGSCGFRAKKAGYCGKHAKLLLRYDSEDDMDSDIGR